MRAIDPERHVAAVRAYVAAGYDHLVLLGVGPDQEGFLRFLGEGARTAAPPALKQARASC